MTPAYKPDWFNLDDYISHTGTMGAKEWGIVLRRRGQMYRSTIDKKNDPTAYETIKNWTYSHFPFTPVKAPINNSSRVKTPTIGTLAYAWGYYSSLPKVEPLASQLLENDWPKNESDEIAGLRKTSLDLLDREAGLFFKPFGGSVLVDIDIMSSEEQLVADFKKWLTNYKNELKLEPRKKNYASKDFKKWHETKLLPCIDLLIHNKYAENELTHFQIGCLLFPDETDVNISERVRKTTIVDAKELLEEETSLALQRQAAI